MFVQRSKRVLYFFFKSFGLKVRITNDHLNFTLETVLEKLFTGEPTSYMDKSKPPLLTVTISPTHFCIPTTRYLSITITFSNSGGRCDYKDGHRGNRTYGTHCSDVFSPCLLSFRGLVPSSLYHLRYSVDSNE